MCESDQEDATIVVVVIDTEQERLAMQIKDESIVQALPLKVFLVM